ncbi:beta-ketoacyl-[acyl-carrier-protein] synthase family protein, partial [Bacillus velezensis]|uniref:hypothetical protein n=1 Tax=Bacillus velezensis TaxID=492670 RepID=UPI0011AA6C07
PIPNPHTQAQFISQPLPKPHIHPNTLNYIQPHPTPTSLPHPIQIQPLKHSYQFNHPSAIPSVKSNIPHLQTPPPITPITKLLLQFKHKTIAPSFHPPQFNPNIHFHHTPFFLHQKQTQSN